MVLPSMSLYFQLKSHSKLSNKESVFEWMIARMFCVFLCTFPSIDYVCVCVFSKPCGFKAIKWTFSFVTLWVSAGKILVFSSTDVWREYTVEDCCSYSCERHFSWDQNTMTSQNTAIATIWVCACVCASAYAYAYTCLNICASLCVVLTLYMCLWSSS